MTNEQILKKAIEKAMKNGYGFPELFNVPPNSKITKVSIPNGALTDFFINNHYYSLIFSHNFAKAFWREKPSYLWAGGRKRELAFWEFQLQCLVLESEPLKYIEKFLIYEPKK